MKSEKAVTLITLVITIVVLIILTSTLTVNMGEYGNQRRKTNFETDLQRLKEQVDQYYAINDKLPIINSYGTTSMLEKFINVNDNEQYYVIDISELNIELNYGEDYNIIKEKDIKEEITDLLDVYIINEQSHTIYYPKGIEYDGSYHYTSDEIYNDIKVEGYVNKPKLAEGMTPIKFTMPTSTEEGTVIETKESDENWYQYGTTYETRKWANAKTADGSMWVWIPRYAYKITYYTDETKEVKSATKTEYGDIDVVFLIGTTDNYYDENGAIKTAKRATLENVKEDGTPVDTTKDYYVHPAFTDESSIGYANGGWDEELTGIWLAKFEAGYVGEANEPDTAKDSNITYTTISGNTGNGTTSNYYYGIRTETTKLKYPTFQANRPSYNNISVADAFTLCKELTNTGNPYELSYKVDSHLMKNSEWGAIAYLAWSKYGQESKEIRINNVSANNQNTIFAITGYGAKEDNETQNTTLELKDLLDGKAQGNWKTMQGQFASTTGNMTGVYDINGGAWEEVASIINNGSNNLIYNAKSLIQEINATIINNKMTANTGKSTKYVMIYPFDLTNDNGSEGSQYNFKMNTKIFGDAIRETTVEKAGTTETNWNVSAWNRDYSGFFAGGYPALSRGAGFENSFNSGNFAFNQHHGAPNYNTGFRAVLVP